MHQIKSVISSTFMAATLIATLTSPTLARASSCDEVKERKQRIAKELVKLTKDHPGVMLGVAACVEAAESRPEDERAATMGICVAGVCLFAGEASCGDVARRGLHFILEEAALRSMSPARCREPNPDSAVPAPVAPASVHPPPAINAPGIVIVNKCNHPVRVAIRYADTNRRWSIAGWWSVAANSRTGYLANEGSVLHSNTAVLYFFAESLDESGWRWAGGHSMTIGDHSVPMRRIVDKEGDTEIVLVCEPSAPSA